MNELTIEEQANLLFAIDKRAGIDKELAERLGSLPMLRIQSLTPEERNTLNAFASARVERIQELLQDLPGNEREKKDILPQSSFYLGFLHGVVYGSKYGMIGRD